MTEHDIVQPRETGSLQSGIDKSYLDCAGFAGAIETHYQTGSGVIRDVYEQFYFNFAVLFELTSNLKEETSTREAMTAVENWLDLPPIGNFHKEMEPRCRQGLKVFRLYRKWLAKSGIIGV